MKITLESTTQIVEILNRDGTTKPVQARVWEGQTESGIKCFALITRIAIHKDDVARAPEFDRELQSQRVPTDISVGHGTGVFSLRMFLP
jgi:hypothetical protein